jgi:uncharacterized protein YggE
MVVTAAVTFGQTGWAESARQIVVGGQASISAAPDMAVLSIGAQELRPSAVEAMNAVSNSLARVLELLDAQGIAAKDVQTSSLNLHRRANWDRDQNREVVQGYEASNMLRIRVRDLDQLGTVLAAVLDQGANTMSGLEFTVQDKAPLRDAARQAAVKDAMAKAALYAQAAGVELGAVLEIRDTAAPAMPSYDRAAPVAMMTEAAEIPVAAGEIAQQAQVTMVFEIK